MTAPTVSASTTLDSYSSIQTVLHYALGIAGLFGVGGAFTVGGLPAELISVGVSAIALVAGPVLHTVSVSKNSIVGEILSKVDAANAAILNPPATGASS